MDFTKYIRTIPNYPKPGIQFRDITTLLQNEKSYKAVINELINRYEKKEISAVVGIESRGFIFAAPLAYALGKSFVLARKPGKLPFETFGHDYELEYGKDRIEIHIDAFSKGDKVLLVDDLLATGGTANATATLIEKMGGHLIECAFVVDLPDVGGRRLLESKNIEVFSLCKFSGD